MGLISIVIFASKEAITKYPLMEKLNVVNDIVGKGHVLRLVNWLNCSYNNRQAHCTDYILRKINGWRIVFDLLL